MPTEQQPRLTLKSTNPKDSIGIRKPRCYHVLSGHVQRLVSLAMMEGAMKYGSHNYRVAGVRASVYYDATLEHLDSYWEGETTDPDSGLPHVIKAIASLYVLADAIVQGKCEDDRPPNFVNLQEFKKSLQPIVDDLFRKYPNPVKGYTQKEIDKELSDEKTMEQVESETAALVRRRLGPGTEKIAEALDKGMVPVEKSPSGEPVNYVEEMHKAHGYTPGPRQANTAEAEKGWRNPDADMTAGEQENLEKYSLENRADLGDPVCKVSEPPGRCSSNDIISEGVRKGWHDNPVDSLPTGVLPKD